MQHRTQKCIYLCFAFMKRFVATILAFLYLGSSTGATVHLHYCMNKLADWGLNHEKSPGCGNCDNKKSSEKEKDDCCKNEHKLVKNNADHKTVESSYEFIKMLAPVQLFTYNEFSALQVSSLTEENPVSNAPPRSTKVPVYILKRTFLI